MRAQAEKGKWNFELKKTYTICILNFNFDDTHPDQVVHKVKLIDEDTRTIFCDRLMYWYIEMPKFKKAEGELVTREDKWLYVLKNLTNFSGIPISLSEDAVFKFFFMDAKTAHLTELELQAYYAEKKLEWDRYEIQIKLKNRSQLQ